ncbi:zinc carboxypeptidase [Pseudonocardiaceae bacterium YIM PH 21723]|nr:zinc carboxypeptidase [Pseudonocardiaceae bacterium YIM PH 21723]
MFKPLILATTVLLGLFGTGTAQAAVRDFPTSDAAYHNHAEITQTLNDLQTKYPTMVKPFSLGKSFQGRDIMAAKISADVTVDKDQPELLFICNQHAREHITTEMCLRIAQRYASTPSLITGRAVYVVPTVNPDGKEYDIATGSYRMKRTNMQGAGTDLNRNWGYQWACCGGSSSSPGDETYHGTGAFSAPETAAVKNFVTSRKIGGKQRITQFIDFHNYGQLVMWPYSYTQADTAPGLTAEDLLVYTTTGRQMAQKNGYTPEQASDLYITDGDVMDWMWHDNHIYAYAFEMIGGGANGFYVPASQIESATRVNDGPTDLLVQYADCPPRIAGKTCT